MTHVFKKAVLFAAVVSSVGASAGVKAVAKDLLSVQTRNGRILGAVLGVTQVALHGAVPMYQSTDKGLGKFKAIDKLGCVFPTGINRTGFTARVGVPAQEGFEIAVAENGDVTLPAVKDTVTKDRIDAALAAKFVEVSGDKFVLVAEKVVPKEEAAFDEVAFTYKKTDEAEKAAELADAKKAHKLAVEASKKAIAEAEAFNKARGDVVANKVGKIVVKATSKVEARNAATKLGTAQNASTLACYVYLLGAAINYKSAPKA